MLEGVDELPHLADSETQFTGHNNYVNALILFASCLLERTWLLLKLGFTTDLDTHHTLFDAVKKVWRRLKVIYDTEHLFQKGAKKVAAKPYHAVT